jgi:hypothetical protein
MSEFSSTLTFKYRKLTNVFGKQWLRFNILNADHNKIETVLDRNKRTLKCANIWFGTYWVRSDIPIIITVWGVIPIGVDLD